MQEMLLYSLKHRFQSKVDVVRVLNTTPDFQTGTRSVKKVVYSLEAAIEVTNKWLEKVFNKTGVDINTKAWIIDPRDLPEDFTPRANDYIQDYGNVNRVQEPGLIAVYLVKSAEIIDGGMLVEGTRVLTAERYAILSPEAVDAIYLGEQNG